MCFKNKQGECIYEGTHSSYLWKEALKKRTKLREPKKSEEGGNHEEKSKQTLPQKIWQTNKAELRRPKSEIFEEERKEEVMYREVFALLF